MLVLALTTAAVSAELHAGIDPSAMPLLVDPVYVEPVDGWSARVGDEAGGRVRVVVARSEEEARAWFEERRARLKREPRNLLLGADEAVGDHHAAALAREDNVVVHVERPGGGAAELARLLLDHLAAPEPWPTDPPVTLDGSVLTVGGAWSSVVVHAPPITVDPATRLPIQEPVVPLGDAKFDLGRNREVTVTVWDRYGRRAGAEVSRAPHHAGADRP